MKQILRTYFYTFLLIFIPFTLLSFIFALLSYFIQWNGTIFYIIIEILSYFILIISALYFTSRLENKRLHHSLLFAFIYFILSLLIHSGNVNIIHLVCKPLLFIIIGILKDKLLKQD